MKAIVLETVQWASLHDVDDLDPISDRDHEVLAELRDVLRRRGYTDRFGICLLHKHFDLGDEEVLMEQTDTASRTSTLEVRPRHELEVGRTIETMWRFSGRDAVVADTKCVQGCAYNSGHIPVHRAVGV